MKIFVAITGASGAAYGLACVEKALFLGHEVYVTSTETGLAILSEEIDGMEGVTKESFPEKLSGRFSLSPRGPIVLKEDDFHASFASGSSPPDGMIVAPCSMGTMGRIASGISGNLIERGADVCMKEKKKLVLVVRETPLNLIHIRNMERLVLAGAVVMPAAPGFYHRPKSLEELVEFIAERALTHAGVPGALSRNWGEKEDAL